MRLTYFANLVLLMSVMEVKIDIVVKDLCLKIHPTKCNYKRFKEKIQRDCGIYHIVWRKIKNVTSVANVEDVIHEDGFSVSTEATIQAEYAKFEVPSTSVWSVKQLLPASGDQGVDNLNHVPGIQTAQHHLHIGGHHRGAGEGLRGLAVRVCAGPDIVIGLPPPLV